MVQALGRLDAVPYGFVCIGYMSIRALMAGFGDAGVATGLKGDQWRWFSDDVSEPDRVPLPDSVQSCGSK
jgi:hypothetical protein